MPPEFEELDPQGLPPEAAPEGQPTPSADAAPEPEYVEIRNRAIEYEGRVEKEQFQDFADKLGLDADRLRQALQIGLDGTRLYEDLNEERDRIRQAAEEVARLREAQGRTPTTRPTESGQPPARERYVTRPPEGDVPGNIYWLADTMERLQPLLERVPHIESTLEETRRRFERAEEQKDIAEERSAAHRAYSEVAESWKKQNWNIPSQKELERELRRFPISDDIDLSWHDIWDRVAWMVNGPKIVRDARRQSVLDTQNNKGGKITIPASGSMGMAPATPVSNGADDNASLDAEAAQLEQQLKGATLAGVFGDRRPLR